LDERVEVEQHTWESWYS